MRPLLALDVDGPIVLFGAQEGPEVFEAWAGELPRGALAPRRGEFGWTWGARSRSQDSPGAGRRDGAHGRRKRSDDLATRALGNRFGLPAVYLYETGRLETGQELEERLLAKEKLARDHFADRARLLEEAYRRQWERIAYRRSKV